MYILNKLKETTMKNINTNNANATVAAINPSFTDKLAMFVDTDNPMYWWMKYTTTPTMAKLVEGIDPDTLPIPVLGVLINFICKYERSANTKEFKEMRSIISQDFSNETPSLGTECIPHKMLISLFSLIKYNNGAFKSEAQRNLFLSFNGTSGRDLTNYRCGATPQFRFNFVFDANGIYFVTKTSLTTNVTTVYFQRTEATAKRTIAAIEFKEEQKTLATERERLDNLFREYDNKMLVIDGRKFDPRYDILPHYLQNELEAKVNYFTDMNEDGTLVLNLGKLDAMVAELNKSLAITPSSLAVVIDLINKDIKILNLLKEFLLAEGLTFKPDQSAKFYIAKGHIKEGEKYPSLYFPVRK